MTATYIARAGHFFNGQYQFDFNAGDPSRGTVQASQNTVFLDQVATLSNASSYTVTEGPGGADYDGSVIGWLAGDTVITCGNNPSVCNDFITGVYSFAQNQFVGQINISGTLHSATSTPEPRYWGLLVLCIGFTAIRKRRFQS